ncbi:hypothetical protein C5F50_09400 [Nitrosopumilus ureiphilus]|uniref:Uncharacterized protein n=1 Tax=Nitrosopumilus ureiphilus TaxID=1470067 RepID=A0A7D5MAW8_9ARCH|nr:hypothetical protein C5F50_09400 [Nitrosopumilus ureiphilus]
MTYYITTHIQIFDNIVFLTFNSGLDKLAEPIVFCFELWCVRFHPNPKGFGFSRSHSINQVETLITNSQIITLGKYHTTQRGENTHD